MNYKQGKAKARAEAIAYQQQTAENVQSWGDILNDNEYFYKLGKKYGLIKEFRENGII